MQFLPVQENFSRNNYLSTWKTTCCDIKFPPSSWTGNFFLWQEIFLVTIQYVARNSFLWPETSYCGKKFFPMTRIFSCCKKFLPVTRNFFLYKKSSCGKKFLTVARHFLLWLVISFCGKTFLPAGKHLFDRNFLLPFAENTFLSYLWQKLSYCGK